MNYRLGFTTGVDATRDTSLEGQVEAVSRLIDNICKRRFYAATETRYYTPTNHALCYVDDLLTVTTLSTDADSDLDYDDEWDNTTDYLLMPRNALLDGWPYEWIEPHPSGNHLFPATASGKGLSASVKIIGSFGFCATGSEPEPITEACLLATQQLFKRKDAIYGVTGPVGMSFEMKTALLGDPHIRTLLSPYVRVF